MDVKRLKKALIYCFKAGITLNIVGPHGVGKSQGVRQAVEGEGIGKVWDWRLGQAADAGDLTGLLDPSSDNPYCEFKMPQRIYEMIEYCKANPDKYGVMFLDEMNRTTKDILQCVFQIVLDHELNGTKFPENLRCVTSNNPATDDYSVLDFDDKAFADRFCHVRFEPTVDDWLEYARQEGVDPSIVAFIGDQPEALKAKGKDFELQVERSPRSWIAANRLKALNPPKAVFQELLIGLIGSEYATAYLTYLKNYSETIKGIEVLDNYKKHKKAVQRYASNEHNREDLLNNVCKDIKTEFENTDKISKKWEKNFVAFILDIPKGLAYNFINELFTVDSFKCTESDPEKGFTDGTFKESQQLIDLMVNWKQNVQKDAGVKVTGIENE